MCVFLYLELRDKSLGNVKLIHHMHPQNPCTVRATCQQDLHSIKNFYITYKMYFGPMSKVYPLNFTHSVLFSFSDKQL